MDKHKVLIVDDESGVRFGIRKFLNKHGWDVAEADTCGMAEEVFISSSFDAIVVDYMLPDGKGLDLMLKLKAIDSDIPFIILTGHGTIDLAVQAMKVGAEHFLTKPVKLQTLLVLLERMRETQRDRRKQMARGSRQARTSVDPFLGTSKAMTRLAEQAAKIVTTERPILIQGETGSGKSLLAKWLHKNGPQADEAFVDLNCAGLTKEFLETEIFGHEKGAFTGAVTTKRGLLEIAHRGTLFLDEIGDMDLQVQPKLLKALEEKQFRRLGDVRDRHVNVRLIAATHQDLSLLVKEKRFRADLYFRISAIPLVIPALRERVEDIPVVAQRLLDSIATDLGRSEIKLAEDAITALQSYSWPGNIRELRNVLDRAALLSGGTVLERKDLLFEFTPAAESFICDSDFTLDDVEKQYIERILQLEDGSVEGAARRLKLPRSSLYYKIKKHGIELSGE
jgi:DNA-binding NtrC family response regulator